MWQSSGTRALPNCLPAASCSLCGRASVPTRRGCRAAASWKSGSGSQPKWKEELATVRKEKFGSAAETSSQPGQQQMGQERRKPDESEGQGFGFTGYSEEQAGGASWAADLDSGFGDDDGASEADAVLSWAVDDEDDSEVDGALSWADAFGEGDAADDDGISGASPAQQSGKGGSWATSEDIFNLEEGWSLDVLGDDAHAEASFAMDEDEEEGLGMAARSILASMPAHKLHALEADQDAADEANAALKANERRSAAAERKTHNRLRIISGTAAGKRIRSSRGEQTRPMMEKVRGAVFDMLLSHAGGTGQFPANARWLDLFAGTGSVGIEALSRGCGQAHFIELDRWVVDSVLAPNLESCGVVAKATVHTMKAEDFLRRSAELVRFAGGAFDYISVCPPYLLVSYPELFQLLETSPLVHKDTVIVVEYPKRSAHEIPDQVKNLARVRDRQYGRTFVAIFAAEE